MNNIDAFPKKKKKKLSIACQTSKSLTFLELKRDHGNYLIPSSGFTSKDTRILKGVIIYPEFHSY